MNIVTWKGESAWNLIAFNVLESKSIGSSQRKAEDRENFKSLIDDTGLDSIEIIDAVRLGASTPNKFHPLRVQYANLRCKSQKVFFG